MDINHATDDISTSAGAKPTLGSKVVATLTEANVYTQPQDVSAGGIYVGGSAADNLFNDYDKNLNWSPTITCATPGDLSVTYTGQVGRARQVGNRVDFNLRITTSAFTHSTASGAVRISLPTTADATAGNNAPCSSLFSHWTAPANYTKLGGKVITGTAYVEFRGESNTGLAIVVTQITEFASGSNLVIEIGGTYEV